MKKIRIFIYIFILTGMLLARIPIGPDDDDFPSETRDAWNGVNNLRNLPEPDTAHIANSQSEILVSEDIPRLLPFSFGIELELSSDVFSEEGSGLIESGLIELINYTTQENENED